MIKIGIELTENQEKVIKDKYLVGVESVKELFETVSKNIALSEILFHDEFDPDKHLEGVSFEVVEDNIHSLRTDTFLFHSALSSQEEIRGNFKELLSQLEDLSETEEFKEAVEEKEEVFYDLMSNFKFLPNSPTLMNAGRPLQQLSACFVLPVPDSIPEIYDSVKNMAVIQKSGGGTGFSFSSLRPKNDVVRTTKGVSSGPISFTKLFDVSTEVIKQGGMRRGANMAVLRYDHPDIREFILAKNKEEVLENFNISVAVTEEFIEKAERGENYDLINPRNDEKVGEESADEIFDLIVKNAWATGDPGVIFIDRINQSNSNPVPGEGRITSTNPCGEQPLLPFEPCNLGSINLSKFVEDGEFDFDFLEETVHKAIRFLDDVIDINNYPLEKIEVMAKRNRRIGLGVMGLAETLSMLGIPYNSEEGFEFGEKIMSFINEKALEASNKIAEEKGVFPNYKDSIYDKKGEHFRGVDSKPRNAARTTIAPTGTIAIAAGLQGSGIEPFFALAYVRYNAEALDALDRGEEPKEKNTFFEVNPVFEEEAEENDYFGLDPEELWKKIDDNHGSVQGLEEVPEEIQERFPVAHDMTPQEHVNMQAAFQRHTDNAVSKTINFPNSATKEDIRDGYLSAYEKGLKGITVYRDGCKSQQVLNLENSDDEEKDDEVEETAEDKSKEDKEVDDVEDQKCPECGTKLALQEGCSTCPNCGHSACGVK